MKYNKCDYNIFLFKDDPLKRKAIPSANGEFVARGKNYFENIGKGEIIYDSPVFDYFHLQSYGPIEEWEWHLQDVHGGFGEYPRGGYWYISDKCKKLFERFNIAIGFHFYATKLLYKGEKLDYWIFQIAVKENGLSNISYIDFQQSIFCKEDDNIIIEVNNYEEFKNVRAEVELNSDYRKDLITKKIVLKEEVDFLPLFGINNSGVIVSERLRIAMENENLNGFLFNELGYEVEFPSLGEG